MKKALLFSVLILYLQLLACSRFNSDIRGIGGKSQRNICPFGKDTSLFHFLFCRHLSWCLVGGGTGRSHRCQAVSNSPGREPGGKMSSTLLSCLSVHHQIMNEAYSLFPTAFPPALSPENGSPIVNSFACLWPDPQISTPSLKEIA